MEEPLAGAGEAVDGGEDGSAGFGFGSCGAGEDSIYRKPPRRILSRRRSSFSIVQPPAAAYLDASSSDSGITGSAGGAGGVSSTAVIVATSRLGQGASGVAFSVSNHIDGKTYVLKRIRLEGAKRDEAALYNEPRLHASIKHQNVVSYQYSWVEREDASGASALCILLERGDAELWSLLVRTDDPPSGAFVASSGAPDPHPPPGVGQRLKWACELASAVAAVHQAGVVHRDISPWVRNANAWNTIGLLYVLEGEGSRRNRFPQKQNVFIASWCVKLGDFGLAARLDSDNTQQQQQQQHHLLSGLHTPGCMPLDQSALGSIFSAPELGSAAYGHAGKHRPAKG